MKKCFFITGTDTDVGKTFVATKLLKEFNARGLSTAALKPVAAGCEKIDGQWRNDDALLLQKAAAINLPYSVVNPFAFPAAIAPHLAAKDFGVAMSVASVAEACKPGLAQSADVILIEGAGGWHVPLNNTERFSDLVIAEKWPVILVVGLRLGCINHALLTIEALNSSGLNVAAWVANCVDPHMPHQAENIDTLKQFIAAPCLGVVPFQSAEMDEADTNCLSTELIVPSSFLQT
ncbi:MAG: dethiobiotin synthase [Gammaproteobacteria bacterium]|nr:dethiobiotin synthase [Gammaproteobacteria bacterium]